MFKIKQIVTRILLVIFLGSTLGTWLVNAADSSTVTIEGTNINVTDTTTWGTSTWTSWSTVDISYNYSWALWTVISGLLDSGLKYTTWDMNGDWIPDIVVEKKGTDWKTYLDLYVFRNWGYEVAATVDTKTISRSFLWGDQTSEDGKLYSWVILALNENTTNLCSEPYSDFVKKWFINSTNGSEDMKKILPCLRKVNSSTNNTIRINWDIYKNNRIVYWDESFLKIPMNYTSTYWLDYYFVEDESGKWKLLIQVSVVGAIDDRVTIISKDLIWTVWSWTVPSSYFPYVDTDSSQDIDWIFTSFWSSRQRGGRSRLRYKGSTKFAGLTLILETTQEMFNNPLTVTTNSSWKIWNIDYSSLGYPTLSSKLISKVDINWDNSNDLVIYKTDPKVEDNIATTYLYDSAKQIYVFSSGSGGGSTTITWDKMTEDINNDTFGDAIFTLKRGEYTTASYYINNNWQYDLALNIPQATIITYKDLNQDDNSTLKWAKDIIITKKVWTSILHEVYVYNKSTKTFRNVLEWNSIEALSYLYQDVNGDWDLDLIFKKSDWLFYLYTYDTDWTGGDVENSMKLLTTIDWEKFKFLNLNTDTAKDLVTRKYLGLFWGKKYYKFDVFFFDSSTNTYVKKHPDNMLLGTDLNLFTDEVNTSWLIDYNKDWIKDIVLDWATIKWIYYYEWASGTYKYLNKINQTENLSDYVLYNDTTSWEGILADDHIILVDTNWKVNHYYYNTTSKTYTNVEATYNWEVYWVSPININFWTKKLTDLKEFNVFTVNWKKIYVLRDKDNKITIFKWYDLIKPVWDNIVSGLVSSKNLTETSYIDFDYFKNWWKDKYAFFIDTSAIWFEDTTLNTFSYNSSLASTMTYMNRSVFEYNWKNTLISSSASQIEKLKAAYYINDILQISAENWVAYAQNIVTQWSTGSQSCTVPPQEWTRWTWTRYGRTDIWRYWTKAGYTFVKDWVTFNCRFQRRYNGRVRQRTTAVTYYVAPTKINNYFSFLGTQIVKNLGKTILQGSPSSWYVSTSLIWIVTKADKEDLFWNYTTVDSIYPLLSFDLTSKDNVINELNPTSISETKTCTASGRRGNRTKYCTVTFSDGSTQQASCSARLRDNCTASKTATISINELTKKVNKSDWTSILSYNVPQYSTTFLTYLSTLKKLGYENSQTTRWNDDFIKPLKGSLVTWLLSTSSRRSTNHPNMTFWTVTSWISLNNRDPIIGNFSTLSWLTTSLANLRWACTAVNVTTRSTHRGVRKGRYNCDFTWVNVGHTIYK